MRPLYEMFNEAVLKTKQSLEIASENPISKKGYVHLQKVTITPTRMIFDAPELIMGNRVIRAMPEKYPSYKFLRVAFCDDDFSRVQPYIGKHFIDNFIFDPLKQGIKISG